MFLVEEVNDSNYSLLEALVVINSTLRMHYSKTCGTLRDESVKERRTQETAFVFKFSEAKTLRVRSSIKARLILPLHPILLDASWRCNLAKSKNRMVLEDLAGDRLVQMARATLADPRVSTLFAQRSVNPRKKGWFRSSPIAGR